MAVKVDMDKAYYKVDWRFLLEILRCLGFSEKWCHWISVYLYSLILDSA